MKSAARRKRETTAANVNYIKRKGAFQQNGAKFEENRDVGTKKTAFENFENAFKIIKNHSGKNPNDFDIAFLSSDYHLHRAGIIAQRCGFSKIILTLFPYNYKLI